MDLLERLAERYDEASDFSQRPLQWLDEKAHESAWARQREIFESVRDHRYTAVHSAHELGKSFIASRAIAWWIDSHPPGEAFVISTAPSAAQVSAVMWREVGKIHRRAALSGKINRAGYPQWYIGPELVGYGRKPSDYEQSAFQGIHARYVLVVIDEACGVVKSLYDAIDSIVANENSRVLAIGNPDDPGSHFASVCKPGSDWHVIHLDALRSPNMSRARVVGPDPSSPRYPLTAALMQAEGVPYSTEEISQSLSELLVDPLWIEERCRRWGGFTKTAHIDYAPDELGMLVRSRTEASALFQAKVRGVFPNDKSTGVIPLGWYRQAVNRWRDWKDAGGDLSAVPNPTRHVVGVDVAYTGEDETVLALRYGDCVPELKRYRQADTQETADFASATLHTTRSMAVVDVIGIGAGVYDTLRRYKKRNMIQATVMPFNAGASSTRRDVIGEFRFRNDRAAAWWKLRELLDPSRGSRLMLPEDERLEEELTAVQWKILAGGIIQIESKDDIRKRLGRSTDSADAVIQAFWPDGLTASSFDDGDVEYSNRNPFEHLDTDYEDAVRFSEADMSAAPGIVGANRNAEIYGDIKHAETFSMDWSDL